MKKIYTLFLILLPFLTGCDFLDRMPDDPMSFEAIWQKQGDTQKYLFNVYGYLPDDGNFEHQFAQTAVGDEGCSTYQGRFTASYVYEEYNATQASIFDELYNKPYRGIHEASVFIDNVDKCLEALPDYRAQMKAEAQYLRAYYYFCILRYFGPVMFNGYNSTDVLEDNIETRDRDRWQLFIDLILKDLNDAIPHLPHEYDLENYLGRATKGAAIALKARMLLYNARPLFNGQVILGKDDEVTPTYIYDNVRNNKGEQIFNVKYDKNRWKLAVDAAREMIDYAEEEGRFVLLNTSTNPDPLLRGLENLNEFYVGARVHPEHIWTYQKGGGGMRKAITPANLIYNFDQGWSSFGPTYKMIDAFAMKSGVYPIKTEHWISEEYAKGKNVNERSSKQVDPRARQEGYSETGGKPMKNPLLVATNFNVDKYPVQEMMTPNRFIDREARFYRNVAWSGMQYICGGQEILTEDDGLEFYQYGMNGYPNVHDFPPTGFLAIKYYDPKLNLATTGMGSYTFPIFRLAGVYLDYIEALNEWDPTHNDIYKYWDMIRDRVGLPSILEHYPEIEGDKYLQREFIRRERMVEMAYESQRHIDCRTWMIAEQTNAGYTIGCQLKATDDEVDGDFWNRVEIADDRYAFGDNGKKMQPRVFTKRAYLLPIPTSELNKVPSLRNSQNIGW